MVDQAQQSTAAGQSEERPLLTIQQVAQRGHLSGKTVRNLIHAGQLPAVRLGRQLRVHPDVAERFLREGTGPATKAA